MVGNNNPGRGRYEGWRGRGGRGGRGGRSGGAWRRWLGIQTPRERENYEHYNLTIENQEADFPLEPYFNGYQLIGDSQLVRFAQTILKKHVRRSRNRLFLGLAISGQTTDQLIHVLENEVYGVNNKVLLMIGTSDLLKHVSTNTICRNINQIVDMLTEKTNEIVICTLAPIPVMCNESHWVALQEINDAIRSMGSDTYNIKVADIENIFSTICGNNEKTWRPDLYEISYASGTPDLLHFNSKGLTSLCHYLIDNNFVPNF